MGRDIVPLNPQLPPGRPGGLTRQELTRRLKESVSSHKTGLPKKLLDLFAPSICLDFAPRLRKKPAALPYTGVTQYLNNFAGPGDAEYEPPPPAGRPPSPRLYRNKEFGSQARIDSESRIEKKIRMTKWRQEDAERVCQERAKTWDPHKDAGVQGDPFKTLFIARLSFDVTEKKLKKEMEEFGPVKRVRIVTNKTTGKPRGYAFVEYEHKKDMKDAYKLVDGRKIEGRRIVADVERGRTVDNWKPRKLGGGLGGQSRAPKEPKKGGAAAVPAIEEPRSAFPDRGNFRGERERPREDMRFERERERSPIRRDRERFDRERPGPDRDRMDRERMDRERMDPRDRDRKRGRDGSPRRDDDSKRVREEGEVREPRRDRRRERDMV